MPKQIIGKIPEFTDGDIQPEEEGIEEEKQPVADEVIEEEKDTPTELPAEEEPAEEEPEKEPEGEDASAVQGLVNEKEKLLTEIRELRGQRREIKKEEPSLIDKKEDVLDDIDPEYAKTIERVIKAKGYITKEEANSLTYETVRKTSLDKFLDKYPEYKPENDPDDINWNALQRELALYKSPSNPSLFTKILEKAHETISPKPGGQKTTTKKLETARLGSGGEKRPSSKQTLTPTQKEEYRRGGWSEEEINDLET